MKTALDSDLPIPLTPHEFYVLLALAEAQDNGYGLRPRAEEDSLGTVTLASGTLYPLLTRLIRLNYLTIIATPQASGRTGVSKVYRLSATGAMVLGWELDRYASAVRLGQARLKILKSRFPDSVE